MPRTSPCAAMTNRQPKASYDMSGCLVGVNQDESWANSTERRLRRADAQLSMKHCEWKGVRLGRSSDGRRSALWGANRKSNHFWRHCGSRVKVKVFELRPRQRVSLEVDGYDDSSKGPRFLAEEHTNTSTEVFEFYRSLVYLAIGAHWS